MQTGSSARLFSKLPPSINSPERHSASNIAEMTKSVAEGSGIVQEQLAGFVCDEAANMVAGCRRLKGDLPNLLTISCACHRLQTAIRHTLELDNIKSLLA